MRTTMRCLGTLALIVCLAACASPGAAEGTSCCAPKKMSCACCSKGGTEGKAAEGHQH
jgi:hypothetical protein